MRRASRPFFFIQPEETTTTGNRRLFFPRIPGGGIRVLGSLKRWQSRWCRSAVVLALVGLANCREQPTVVEDHEPSLPTQKIGASMAIAWPFGTAQDPDDWYGVNGTRTSGAYIYIRCYGRKAYTHSGADVYARDLSREGDEIGTPIYAGFTGLIVMAGDYGDGYGNQVVIYDHSRRVAIRYAHLSRVGVSVGQTVSIRQYIGKLGCTGTCFGTHLHLVGYENIDHFRDNDPTRPVIPTLCDSDYYAVIVFFIC